MPWPTRPRVLILCTGNSARSQMAEGLLRHDGGAAFDVSSAGIRPTEVRAEAVEVMAEIGVDISQQYSKNVSDFEGERFDYVLTVCDQARETCPVWPGARQVHWSIPDPAAMGQNREQRLAAFRAARDELRWRLREFIHEIPPGERLP